MRTLKKAKFVSVLTLLMGMATLAQEKQTAESVIARHLESLGTPQQLGSTKSRSATGAVELCTTANLPCELKGPAWVFAEGHKLRIAFPFGHQEYPGEHAVFDGEKAALQSKLGGQRSSLGQFLTMFDAVLREGLWGGTLSMHWPLLDFKAGQAKVQYEGLKTVDGVSAHILTYQPKKAIGSMRIQLAFDRETLRHVRTTYRVKLPTPLMASLSAFLVGIQTIPASQETQITVEEIFDGFETHDGIVLPTLWTIRVTQRIVATDMSATVTTSRLGAPGTTDPSKPRVLEWRAKLTKFAHNEQIPPEVFVLQP